MEKEQAKEIIKEFQCWHDKISLSNWGNFPSKWRQTSEMKADLKDGYWYWDGYKLSNLYKKYDI